MGFRKNDDEENARRDRAFEERVRKSNERLVDFMNRHGEIPVAEMSNNLHLLPQPIVMLCSECLASLSSSPSFVTPEKEEQLSTLHIISSASEVEEMLNDENWFSRPILPVCCENGHYNEVQLNYYLHLGNYPVYMMFDEIGVTWKDNALIVGHIETLINGGNWTLEDSETGSGVAV